MRLQDTQRRQKYGILFPKKFPDGHELGKINPLMAASCLGYSIDTGELVEESGDLCHITLQNRGNDIIHDFIRIRDSINGKITDYEDDNEMLLEVGESIKLDHDFNAVNSCNAKRVSVVLLSSLKNSVGVEYYQVLAVVLSRSVNDERIFNVTGYNAKICYCLLEAEEVFQKLINQLSEE